MKEKPEIKIIPKYTGLCPQIFQALEDLATGTKEINYEEVTSFNRTNMARYYPGNKVKLKGSEVVWFITMAGDTTYDEQGIEHQVPDEAIEYLAIDVNNKLNTRKFLLFEVESKVYNITFR